MFFTQPCAKLPPGGRRCQRLRGEGHERWQGGGGGTGRKFLQVRGLGLRDVGPGDEGLPSGRFNSLLLKMALKIVDLPIENGDFPELRERLAEGMYHVV